jgi:hypothetical protein
MVRNLAGDYFKIRSGFPTLHEELGKRPFKIAFLGNSVSAQKDGYRKFLCDLIDQKYSQKHQYINAGIGGVGSLVSAFLIDDFVLRYEPDICFIECTVADIGKATPQQYIAPAVEGIIQKLLAARCKICFLHLYNSHTDEERKDAVISIYEKLAEHYKLPSINISKALGSSVYAGEQLSNDLVYDGIHTTDFGAKITSDHIFSAFEAMVKKETDSDNFSHDVPKINPFPFRYTQIIRPTSSMLDSSKDYKEKRFRAIIKYIEVDENNAVRFTPQEGELLGVLIIADSESGVLEIEINSEKTFVQTHDLWCDKERIQAVILDEPVTSGNEFKISLSTHSKADRGANGTANAMMKKGISLKVIGLMIATKSESKTITKLW